MGERSVSAAPSGAAAPHASDETWPEIAGSDRVGRRGRTSLLAGLVVLAALAAPQIATAAVSNYRFPDGSIGFALSTSGGLVNPGVLVGFNPQPDPPGDQSLDLSNWFAPVLTTNSRSETFRFVLSVVGLSRFESMLLPAMPNSDGRTRYGFCDGSVRPGEGGTKTCDGSVFVADLAFSGPGGVTSWSAFNPQPEPPGKSLAYLVGMGDASVTVSLTENGVPLAFAPAPEPATWAMMGLGFAALGALTLCARAKAAVA